MCVVNDDPVKVTIVSKSSLLIVALLLVSCALVAVFSFMIRPVSDDSLARWFTRSRAEMDHLVSILATNPNVVLVQRHAQSKDVLLLTDGAGRSIEATEIGAVGAEFGRLFDLLDCDSASQNASEVIISFRRNGVEDLYPGGYKVIAFRSNKPAFIVGSLDDFRRTNRGKYGFYQPLEGSWYLKYEEAH